MTDWAVYFEAQAPQRVVLNLIAPGLTPLSCRRPVQARAWTRCATVPTS